MYLLKQVSYVKYAADRRVECFKCKGDITPEITEVNVQIELGSLMIYYKCSYCAYQGFVRLHLKDVPEGNIK